MFGYIFYFTLGMQDALEWLKDNFSDAADDVEEDDDNDENGIPLVTILDCSVEAMENSDFQKLLIAFGVSKPASEQVSVNYVWVGYILDVLAKTFYMK